MRSTGLTHQRPLLQVQRREVDDVAVLQASGTLDLFTAPTMRETLDAAAADAANGVVVDLSDVQFIDSTGVAVLVHARRGVRSGRFAVACPRQGPVGRLFARIRADEIFAVYERPEDAFVAVR